MTADLKAARERIERATEGLREWGGTPALASVRLADVNVLLTALDQAAEALKPFGGEFADVHVCDEGWTGPMSKTRIVDWFGPSDFRHAATVYATLKPVDTKEGEG